jgi:hypothetical protein
VHAGEPRRRSPFYSQPVQLDNVTFGHRSASVTTGENERDRNRASLTPIEHDLLALSEHPLVDP